MAEAAPAHEFQVYSEANSRMLNLTILNEQILV